MALYEKRKMHSGKSAMVRAKSGEMKAGAKQVGGESFNQMGESAIHAAGVWGFHAVTVRSDLAVCGSPERSEFRCVVECADGYLIVLENIREQDLMRKQAIIDRLDFLARQGLSGVHPCLRAPDGRHIVRIEGRSWQGYPYFPGVRLDRPAYAFDGWRGEVMADFLINLRTASRSMPAELSGPTFSILGYIDVLMSQIEIREPGLTETLAPVTAFLRKRLAPVHDLLPVAFCHGDFHPLNMIWSETALRGVIDWEFSGMKPQNYDAALLIGCMGMENPEALTGELVSVFIRDLKAAQVLSETSWQVLVEMIVAIRFGWLSEWLRTRDTEMIELETDYMHLLMDHADELIRVWQS
jgi:homoserine kinase type II